MNLPNSLTVARIVASPVVALLPFASSWGLRLVGFWLFIAVAVTDYYDGHLARSRDLVTDLGRLLDPLADKLLLLATFVPMFLLVGSGWAAGFLSPHRTPLVAGVLGPMLREGTERGLVIAAIGPAKWKTGFQWTWVGATFFWFAAATAAARYGWTSAAWRGFAYFNALVGIVSMAAAVYLTLYSLWLYMRRYG